MEKNRMNTFVKMVRLDVGKYNTNYKTKMKKSKLEKE